MDTPFIHLAKSFKDAQNARERFFNAYNQNLIEVARLMGETFKSGGKVLICGNGGSAADSQHMAAELVGRMLVERKPLPAIALTTDSSNLTAIGNDYGYDQVFVRQVEALTNPKDILIAITTSGNSKNVLLAVEAAKSRGGIVVGLSGGNGGKLAASGLADHLLLVTEGTSSSMIQEAHIFAIHSIVDIMDRYFLT